MVVSANVFLFDFLVGYFLSLIKISRATGVVLYYHCVQPEERNKFAQQMDDLLRWTKPISLDEPKPPNKGIHHSAVTFDDGLICIIENALPELIKRKIPSTIFVPTGYMGKKPSWVQYDTNRAQQDTVITDKQLKEISNHEMITIGSHCVTHSNLLWIDNESSKWEIFQSKNDLESILGFKIKLLSFPYGGHNATHIELAREAGYERIFTIIPKCIDPELNDFVVGRVRVDPSDWPIEYRLKLLGAYRWLPKVFFIKQKIRLLYQTSKFN